MANETRELYESGKIRVGISSGNADVHDLWVGNDCVILEKDVFDRLAKSDPAYIKGALGNYLGGKFDSALKKNGISYETLARIIAQARIRELEVRLSLVTEMASREKQSLMSQIVRAKMPKS